MEVLDRYEVYDTATDTWRIGKPGMTPRFDLVAARLNDGILTIGGVHGTTVTNLVEITNAFD